MKEYSGVLSDEELQIKEADILIEMRSLKKKAKKLRKIRADKGQKRLSYSCCTSKQFNTYLKRANAKQFEFELTDEMFSNLINCECIYCGGLPTGFDRMDNKIGYTIENSKPCCYKCNMMKGIQKRHDFFKHVKKIHDHQWKFLTVHNI